MAMLLQDLLRPKTYIDINDECIELSSFSVGVEVQATDFLTKVSENKGVEFTDLVNVLWELVKHKEQFKFDKNRLRNLILNSPKNKLMDIGKDIYDKIYSLYADSRPVIKNKSKYQELLKIQQDQGSVPCFGVYFDKLSSRYGLSIEEFSKLTLRQIHSLLMVIGDQRYEELSISASLNGRKLKPRMKFDDDIDEELDKKLDDDALEMFNKMKKAHEEKK